MPSVVSRPCKLIVGSDQNRKWYKNYEISAYAYFTDLSGFGCRKRGLQPSFTRVQRPTDTTPARCARFTAARRPVESHPCQFGAKQRSDYYDYATTTELFYRR